VKPALVAVALVAIVLTGCNTEHKSFADINPYCPHQVGGMRSQEECQQYIAEHRAG
jgi:hypothetical protein